jgi:Xaa-Pro aminopeptidase
MRKGPEEIELIRRACEVTAAAIRAAAREIRPGVDERTLEGVLEAAFKRGGAQRTAFDSIIKSGPNSLWPWRILAAHYDRRNRAMAAGELVIFDVGCELDHYASDVGRTFPVSGRFSPDQARRLRLVTSITDTIIAAVRPGVTLPELRAVAEAATPPEERAHMQTGTFFGHHIGLDVGDANRLDAPLVPGMVFTIEPWYYDHEDGVAVFLEDVVLVTETGAENLTADLPRSIEELERITGP